MTIIQTIILGIVEGLTEFLPISSTAHLLLLSDALRITETEFVKTFTIAIQLGAILAVVVLYFKRFLTDIETLKRVIVAFLPTALVGFALYKIIKGFLFVHPSVSILMLLVFGIFLIVFERNHSAPVVDSVTGEHRELANLPYKTALMIGLAQAVAVVPGVSRSGATIVAGLLLGVSRSAIVEFSFLLAVPTMAAATGYDLLKNAPQFTAGEFHLLAIGFVTAFIAAIIAVRFFLQFISRHSFEAFGWYRIVLALLAAFLLLR